MSHTPEPWHADVRAIYATGISLVASTMNNSRSISSEEDEANAKRIVECVNACAGMENPAKEIAQLRADKARLIEALKQVTNDADEFFEHYGNVFFDIETAKQLLTEMEGK